MTVEMSYGSGKISFELPAGARFHSVCPAAPAADAGPVALAERIAPALAEASADCRGRDVLVLVPDGTRDQPIEAGYTAVTPLLAAARAVRVLVATGTHRADTPDDRRIASAIRRISSERGVPLASVEAHDCRQSAMAPLGTTAAGNEVRLNRRVFEADAIVVLSDMKPHYFAGYSNATKFLLPGVADLEAIERNHAFALAPESSHCRHPLHFRPERRGNPVAADQLDAARLVTGRVPVFALATVRVGEAVAWAAFSELEHVVAEGIRAVDDRLVVRLDRAFPRAVISPGGYPNDETLYIAQRSLELTKEVLADGAEVLWLTECRNGIASSQRVADGFFAPLKGDTAAFIDRIRGRYEMFSHKTVKFVELMSRLSSLRVVSSLPAGTFPAGGMAACEDPQSVVAGWATEGVEILFVDDANRLALTRAPEREVR